MEFLDPKLDDYICKQSEKEPEILYELNRETHLNVLIPRMLSGHLQGRVLSMLSHMIQPKMILEIGTYTGYSALCFAEGLAEGGKIITLDKNDELEEIIQKYISKSNLENVIDYRFGDAIDLIPTIEEEFDIVFIDADKTNYSNYYDLVFDKVKKGGYIIADNVLWSGKVLGKYEELDAESKAIVDYSNKIKEDSRVQNVLFPVRDGLMIARKL